MHWLNIIKIIATALTVIVIVWFLYNRKVEKLTITEQIKTALTGFVANFCDTIGVGSFAVIIAMRNLLGLMPDEVPLIGTMNIQATPIALIQALVFLRFIHVDLKILIVSIIMLTAGGLISGMIAVWISRKLVQRIMLFAFAATGILVLLTQLNIINIPDNATTITGLKLALFSMFMLLAGMLPAFGVGYYALVRVCIFLFGVNPMIAFPLMTTASACQMPFTSMAFVFKRKFYFKSTILLILFGTIGVFIAAAIINRVNSHILNWILFAVIVYNIITLARTALINKNNLKNISSVQQETE